ncbi:hypothetical protein I204_08140 [Kwoniella mangroviensis CBS 8886]|uniref:uncharacterized protein n=1 Tax=Kwoniella mangroviensis CBS 8507 TaxID=1296122 RepID=UPI00080CC73D|nr:uncharacterized protein I203_04500 [Kwoniella mangroviensis CBS 8507]OCF66174.1 hypothetical protein I203_04500 [Kwoniella mangroviensis CBS 8507]OCF71187.1 hypothetical protein I204_08140 [Kwoniella mangroviensis CBS 8886]
MDVKNRNTPDEEIVEPAATSSYNGSCPCLNATETGPSSDPIESLPTTVLLTTTAYSTAIVDAYSSDTTSTILSTTVVPAPASQYTSWETAPSITPEPSSGSSTSTSPSSSSTSSSSSPPKEEDFFGILTYELGQYVIMYDVTANETPYKGTSRDNNTPTNFPVTLITNKSNFSKRRFEIYKPVDNGSWGPEVKDSKCTKRIECDIEFQPDPGNQKNRPAFAVWNDEPWFKNIDPENKCQGSCKFVDY